jgi:hypothetical protein
MVIKRPGAHLAEIRTRMRLAVASVHLDQRVCYAHGWASEAARGSKWRRGDAVV